MYTWGNRIAATVLVSNAGAHGGLLREVSVGDFSYVGAEPPYWVRIARGSLRVGPGDTFQPALPLALEAGDVRMGFLVVELQPAPGVYDGHNDSTKATSA